MVVSELGGDTTAEAVPEDEHRLLVADRVDERDPENLIREVHEETGLTVTVGEPALINEFHDPATGFHQVDIFFRCTISAGAIDATWRDPEGVVTQRRFFSRSDLEYGRIRFKPDSLPQAAWGTGILYDPLEVIVR